jgi:hypothetical protein
MIIIKKIFKKSYIKLFLKVHFYLLSKFIIIYKLCVKHFLLGNYRLYIDFIKIIENIYFYPIL